MQIREGIELANISHAGNRDGDNQDYFGYCEPANEQQFAFKGRIALVADGMGGHRGGQTASRSAVETIIDCFSDWDDCDPSTFLVQAFGCANQVLLDLARIDASLAGMGTTCTAVLFRNGFAHFAHVGDSRLYLVRDGAILQLTHDHSLVSDWVRRGILTAGEAQVHSDRHVLTNALGSSHLEVEINPEPMPLYSGDGFILCSDGLYTMVTDKEMMEHCLGLPVVDAVAQLVDLANSRGGPDNITLQMIRMTQ